jgi:hypothetical protein
MDLFVIIFSGLTVAIIGGLTVVYIVRFFDDIKAKKNNR